MRTWIITKTFYKCTITGFCPTLVALLLAGKCSCTSNNSCNRKYAYISHEQFIAIKTSLTSHPRPSDSIMVHMHGRMVWTDTYLIVLTILHNMHCCMNALGNYLF